jgi:hypothetical protein
MAEFQAGRIVKFLHDEDGNPVFVDDAGRAFTTRAGTFDWQPLPSPTAPAQPAARRPKRSWLAAG